MGNISLRHGELQVRFIINNIHGSDVVLTREEAVTLRYQLDLALRQNGDTDPKPKPTKKLVTVTK